MTGEGASHKLSRDEGSSDSLGCFLPVVLGEWVVLMDNSATVMAYMKTQGSTISRVLSSLARDHVLDRTAFSNLVCSIHSGEDQLGSPNQVLPRVVASQGVLCNL